MAGHAQLKFVMTECSKTQIRLTQSKCYKITMSISFQAANNLTVLAREEGACQIIIQQGGLTKLKELLFSKEEPDILQAGVRVLGSLTQGSKVRVSLV